MSTFVTYSGTDESAHVLYVSAPVHVPDPDELALAVMDDDGYGCAITSTPAVHRHLISLNAYLNVKDRYEHLIGLRNPQDMSASRAAIREAEAEMNAMKEAAGNGGPGDPLCCQRYSLLHHPAFSVTGCRWYGYRAQTATT